VQPDGKVVVGVRSEFWQCDPPPEGGCAVSTTHFLARFNANGSRDTNFLGTNVSVSSIAVQSDGKLLVVGAFSPGKIIRLNADGRVDSSFNPGTGPDSGISSVALQPDGKVLIGGYFSAVNGTIRNGIARLNANGSLDGSFDPGTGVGGFVYSIALQPDGKVLIGGDFTSVNGTNRTNIARLNANGSLDTSFNPGTGADGSVRAIALQSDGNVLIGGDFLTVNGVLRPHIARLYGDSAWPSLSIARSNAFLIVSWPASFGNFQLQENTNVALANGWSAVAAPRSTNNGSVSVSVPASVGSRFYRLNSQ
jgi:uncharacterized delta-60 repeat protein